MRMLLIVIIVSAACVVFYNRGENRASHRASSPPTAAAAKPLPYTPEQATPEMQAKRLEFMQKMVNTGVFHKVEKIGYFPKVYVTPTFMAATIDQKQSIISVVYLYYRITDPRADMVVLRDMRSGKDIGRFAEYLGGLQMD